MSLVVINNNNNNNDTTNTFPRVKPGLRPGGTESLPESSGKVASKAIDAASGSIKDVTKIEQPGEEEEKDSNYPFVDFLLKLAQLPTLELQNKLEESQEDIFQIKSLLESCPFTDNNNYPIWVPPLPPPKKKQPVFVWYEHISKAGGTSFCKVVGDNMKRSEIPPYYCMPQDPKVPIPTAASDVGRIRNYKPTCPQIQKYDWSVTNGNPFRANVFR